MKQLWEIEIRQPMSQDGQVIYNSKGTASMWPNVYHVIADTYSEAVLELTKAGQTGDINTIKRVWGKLVN